MRNKIMLLRNTILEVVCQQQVADIMQPEVERCLLSSLRDFSGKAVVLKGVRRAGKSTLQRQLMQRQKQVLYCNLEDTRLFGMMAEDFPTLLSVIEERLPQGGMVFLDEVQEVEGWERLVRALLDRGQQVCVTGSNASLLGKEVGSKLTGRHLSFEVFPFDYQEFLAFTGQVPGAASLLALLDAGGFPSYLQGRMDQTLQELLRDIVQRDIALRHGLRETRHLMNLALFLLAHTGQTFSMQSLTKSLGIPSVAQTSRYLEYLADAYLLLPLPKFSASFRRRVSAPNKYYAVDNGLRRANSPQATPDRGRRLENQVFLALRSRGESPCYDGEKDLWECDFVTRTAAIQVCCELTPENRRRELRGLLRASRPAGWPPRGALVVTLDQKETLVEDGLTIEVVPAWEWFARKDLAT
jgi:hypothetical protein